MLSQHLPRWVFASITKHFADVCTSAGIDFFVEGELKDEVFIDNYEIRMNGPTQTQVSNKVWRIDVGVSIFVSSQINDTNFHRIHEMVGIISNAYTDIGIFRLGPVAEPANDGSFLGCVKCADINIQHFGQLDPVRKLMRATVDADYTGLITE